MSDPLWYKDAVIYEAHVRAFFDSNSDGIGDFPGLTSQLDYLQDLGINCLWLLPFYPSPLRDDGYDIADYEAIHPSYGTLAGFRSLHGRGAQARHPGDHRTGHQSHLRSASLVPGGAPRAGRIARARLLRLERHATQKYQGVRIIFTDTETSNWTWDDTAKAYYWHRFFHHQPDLNFDNPRGPRARSSRSCGSGSTAASTGCGSTRCRT